MSTDASGAHIALSFSHEQMIKGPTSAANRKFCCLTYETCKAAVCIVLNRRREEGRKVFKSLLALEVVIQIEVEY